MTFEADDEVDTDGDGLETPARKAAGNVKKSLKLRIMHEFCVTNKKLTLADDTGHNALRADGSGPMGPTLLAGELPAFPKADRPPAPD